MILIDEYDKPIVNHLADMKLVANNRDLLRNFYTAIKALDQYLHFIFITGVSKFSKVSLLSGVITGKEIETSHELEKIDIPTLLFQTGYLTIEDYDEKNQIYFLAFPNEEVRRSYEFINEWKTKRL